MFSPVGPLLRPGGGRPSSSMDHQVNVSRLPGLLLLIFRSVSSMLLAADLSMPALSIFDVRFCRYPMQPSPYVHTSVEGLTTCATMPPQRFCRISHGCELWKLTTSRQISTWCSTESYALYARNTRAAEVWYYFLHLNIVLPQA